MYQLLLLALTTVVRVTGRASCFPSRCHSKPLYWFEACQL